MPRFVHACILLAVTLGWIAGVAVQAQETQVNRNAGSSPYDEPQPGQKRLTFRFEMANDAFFDTDSQFSNGLTFQTHSTIAGNLNDRRGLRALGQGIARKLLPQKSDLVYRKALVIGQSMATPDALEEPNIILDDTPYLGLLAAENSWIAFNDVEFTGFAITLGIVGEWSGAEQLQKGVHSLIGATDPMGWHNQLDNEPVLNFFFMKKRKLWNKPSFDGALNFDVAVGNFTSGIGAGIETRFGHKPGGFSYIYDHVGKGMTYDATLTQLGGGAEFYMSLAAKVWAWAVFMPLEGNTLVSGNEWTENNIIDPNKVIGQVISGLHFVSPSWGLHLTLTFATDNVDEDSIRPGLEVNNNFATLMFERRF
jgi:hypothetical protein